MRSMRHCATLALPIARFYRAHRTLLLVSRRGEDYISLHVRSAYSFTGSIMDRMVQGTVSTFSNIAQRTCHS